MKRFLQSYGILLLSLATLFASGVVIGRATAPAASHPQPATATPLSPPTSPESWAISATNRLAADLLLDASSRQAVQNHLTPVATEIFSDQQRALFQMHLRLLAIHDSLAVEIPLDDRQLKRLATSRSQLKSLIIRKFPLMVRENPALAVGESK